MRRSASYIGDEILHGGKSFKNLHDGAEEGHSSTHRQSNYRPKQAPLLPALTYVKNLSKFGATLGRLMHNPSTESLKHANLG